MLAYAFYYLMHAGLSLIVYRNTRMETFKCVAVGSNAVGKTAMTLTFITNEFPQEYVPTVSYTHDCYILVYNCYKPATDM